MKSAYLQKHYYVVEGCHLFTDSIFDFIKHKYKTFIHYCYREREQTDPTVITLHFSF